MDKFISNVFGLFSTKKECNTIMIIGGSGQTGSYIVEEALKDGYFTKVGVLSRQIEEVNQQRQETLDRLASLGAEVVVLDYQNEAEMIDILKDYSTVVAFHSTMGDCAPAKALIDICAQAGVTRFVPNVWGVDYEVNKLPWLVARKDIREYISSKRMEFTEIICGFFMENIISDGAPSVGLSISKKEATFFHDKTAPVSWTHRKDAAKYLVAALKEHEWSRNKQVRVEGDRLSMGAITALFQSKVPSIEIQETFTESTSGISPFAVIAGQGRGISNPGGETLDNTFLKSVKSTTVSEWIENMKL